jgi:hypothetical protein
MKAGGSAQAVECKVQQWPLPTQKSYMNVIPLSFNCHGMGSLYIMDTLDKGMIHVLRRVE